MFQEIVLVFFSADRQQKEEKEEGLIPGKF